MERLEAHDWPGNVRQLRNVMERASIVCEGKKITSSDLELGSRSTPAATSTAVDTAELNYDKVMARHERRLVSQAIAEAKGNITRAAELLGMKRTTLHYRMQTLGIKPTNH
jgi:DNA-binding NtrC family response regulator